MGYLMVNSMEKQTDFPMVMPMAIYLDCRLENPMDCHWVIHLEMQKACPHLEWHLAILTEKQMAILMDCLTVLLMGCSTDFLMEIQMANLTDLKMAFLPKVRPMDYLMVTHLGCLKVKSTEIQTGC